MHTISIRVNILGKDLRVHDTVTLLGDTSQKIRRAVKSNDTATLQKHFGLRKLMNPFWDVTIFPSDKVSDLRDKIYIATGVPTWRQHLFWLNGDEPAQPYRVFVEDAIYTIDIRASTVNPTASGMPVVKQLYEQRATIKVEALDTFIRLDQETWREVYIVDLQHWIDGVQLDEYQLALTYYGFVILHWPQLSLEAYRDATHGNTLHSKYPDLAPTLHTLQTKYTAEALILNKKATEPLAIAITAAAVSIANKRVMLNLRNIFDALVCTADMPEIQYWADLANTRYNIRKKYTRAQVVSFPSNAYTRVGLTCALRVSKPREQPRYMFFNVWPSGRVYVRGTWKEDEETSFANLVPIFADRCNALIKLINSMQHQAFALGSRLLEITPTSIAYDSITCCMYWKRVMLGASFKRIIQCLQPYARAGVIVPRAGQDLAFTLRKGMFEFDPTLLDRVISASGQTVNNYYAYLTNPSVRAKWDLNYDGRPVVITHRTTDIRFEISNLRAREFQTALDTIGGFCHTVANDPEWQKSLQDADYKGVKKLKKLKEQDPELFDLRRWGDNDARVYSILCQNNRQPLIYTDDEVRRMSSKKVNSLTKYWNFTLQRPAWYSCPHAQFPHMSFMTGVHPKGYCLPCCNKREQDANIVETCLTKHTHTDSGSMYEHVIAYGKVVEEGRLSRVPQTGLGQLFPPIDGRTLHVIGCAQSSLSGERHGIVHALAKVFGQTTHDWVRHLIKHITVPINVLVGGLLTEYFADTNALVECMLATFVNYTPATQVPYWPELFVELCQLIHGTACAVFVDQNATGKGITMWTVGGTNSPVCLLLKLEQNYYPLAYTNSTWFQTHEAQYVFVNGDHAHARVRALTSVSTFTEETPSGDAKPVKKYVNMHSLVYGYDIVWQNKTIYIPQEYITLQADGVPATHEVPTGGTLPDLIEWAKAHNIVFTQQMVYQDSVIAMKTNHLVWHVQPHKPQPDIPILKITFDIKEVNRAIMQRSAPTTTLSDKLGKALYNTLQYQLLLVEFVAYIDKERDEEVRALIKKSKKIPDHPAISAADRVLLTQQRNIPATFADSLQNTAYDFDRKTIREFNAATDKTAFLTKVVSNFAVQGDPNVDTFPNVYLPCTETPADYCQNHMLVLRDLPAMVDILASDLMNPLKRLYLLSNIWMENTVNMLEFTRRKEEIVSVYKI